MTATTQGVSEWIETTPVPTAPVETMISAAAYLAREWGEYGYSIGYVGRYGTPDQPYLFRCAHADGSRFYVVSDRYGNCSPHGA